MVLSYTEQSLGWGGIGALAGALWPTGPSAPQAKEYRRKTMATQADVRRIAMSLPGVDEGSERFAFSVRNRDKAKGFIWVWMERVNPKEPRVANDGVLAVRVANVAQKDLIIASSPTKFFTEPHYNGFPAILVRLDKVDVADLEVLVLEAWRCVAPKELVEAGAPPAKPRARPRKAAKKTTKATKRPRGRSS